MIFHLNQLLVRITDIKRSFTETDDYTSPSLEIHYINVDTQENLIEILTPLSPYWNFFSKIETSLKLKLSQITPQPTSTTKLFTLPVISEMGNCFSFKIVFPLQNSSRPPIVEYRDECPNCLKITSCWKKGHPLTPTETNGGTPQRRPTPHLVCRDCRINLFHHSLQPNCPL